MPDGGRLPAVAATLVLLALLGLSVLAFAPAVTAEHANESDAYVIEQGDQCVAVDPIVDETQSVEEFYDYRHPNSEPNATTYSSYGTTEYQADNTSALMLYEGSEGTSLVIVHEKLHEAAGEGTNGSSATFVVTGLSPEDDGWVVEDDDYENHDDQFDHYDTYSEMTWVWAQGRTDGGAYRGLDGDTEIEIDPGFNEDANFRYTNQYAGWVHDWDVITATDGGFDRVPLESLDENVTVRAGYCAAAPNASVTVDDATPEVGVTTVTLDASGTQSGADVTEYRWDVSGDGSVDTTTGDPVLEHVFTDTGERDVAVTAVAEDGQHDTATATVDVVDETPPTASIDAPAEAAVGETIEFSGADSDDNHRIESFQWDVEDGPNTGGETFEHTFDARGEYAVELAVTDPAGNANTANATVTVYEPTGPVASIGAPETSTVGESVTLDASGSVVGANATYEWSVDGESLNASTATHETTFDEPGTREVSVVVSDENGTDDATATIDVVEQLDASVEAMPADATVGETVTFDASGSTGNVDAYEWDFGDETTTDGDATVEHTYEAAGEYEATVTVVDEAGDTDTATVGVTVAESSQQGPTAALDVPETATVGDEVTFDASDSDVGENATYEWIVDSATEETTEDPTFTRTFTTTGTFDVRVEITDEDGTNAATSTLVVEEEDTDDGSDGGSSGGYGPPPTVPDNPVETSVEVENGTVVVTADNVDGYEPFTVDIPANATTGFGAGGTHGNASGANESGAIELRSVEIEAAQHADRMQIAFEPADRDVPGRFVESPALVPNTSADIASITYEFAVDSAATTAAGVSADDLATYAHDGEWRAVGMDASARMDGDHIVATVTTESDAPVGVGADGPVLYVSDVETVGVTTDGSVDLAVTARNTGTDPDEWSVPVAANGAVVAEPSVALGPGEETTFETTVPVGETDGAAIQIDETDGAALRVGEIPRDVAVVSVADLAVTPNEPGPNENASVEATLVNRGAAAGTVEPALHVDGEAVGTERITLEPGERRTVTFDQQFESPGTHDLAVGDVTTSVNVSERDDFDDEESGITSNATPGFGALAALGALLGALAVRRRLAG